MSQGYFRLVTEGLIDGSLKPGMHPQTWEPKVCVDGAALTMTHECSQSIISQNKSPPTIPTQLYASLPSFFLLFPRVSPSGGPQMQPLCVLGS